MIHMENKTGPIVNNCSMAGLKPAMLEFPYPPIQVKCRNLSYADLLSVDYCGSVSELTALTQYVNNESRLSMKNCRCAKMLLEIAVAEMMHLQKLGELIFLLGGEVIIRQDIRTADTASGHRNTWISPGIYGR